MTQRIIKISPSGLNSIQSCFRQAYYHRILGYDSPTDSTSEPLIKGILIHSILELYYNNKLLNKEAVLNISECITKAKELLAQTQLSEETKQHVTTTLVEYFAFYHDDSYIPTHVETPFSYELFENEEVKILLEGKLDLICQREQGNEKIQYIFDHKSRGRDSTPILLQNQYMAYALATGIHNVVDNQIGLQTSLKPKDKYKRRILTYSEDQLNEFADYCIAWVLMFDQSVQSKHFIPNYTSCFQCDFRGVCESKSEFREEKLERFFIKRVKDFDLFSEVNDEAK